jgi:hypoxanthine phosphoribosyltransferase
MLNPVKTRVTLSLRCAYADPMPDRPLRPPERPAIPVIRLAELPALADELAARVRASGFVPERIVYIETGARLFAFELQRSFNVPVVPVWVQRGGHRLKKWAAPIAAHLPVVVRDWLRRAEESSGVQRRTRRVASLPVGTAKFQGRVLLVDDATDTGRTLAVARELVQAYGAAPADVRTAVLAATTPLGQAAADFFLFDRNCRMPWSADSAERREAERRMNQILSSHATRAL